MAGSKDRGQAIPNSGRRQDVPSDQPTIMTIRFDAALRFAAEIHRSQRRKGSGTPYLSHLLQVAGLVLEYGGDEDAAIVALLHDAIEDQGGEAMRATISDAFGDDVARMVEGCSDAISAPKPPWRERKLAHIARVPDEPIAVRLVIAADKLHNMRSVIRDYRRMGEGVWSLFTGGREGSLWYYREMTQALAAVDPTIPIIDELLRTVAELEQLASHDRRPPD